MENDVPEEEGFSVLNPSSSNSTTSTPSTNNNGSKNSASWNMLLEALKTHTSTEISAAVNNGLRLSAYNQRFDEIATVQKSIIEKMTAVEQKLQILSDSIQNGGNGYIRRNNSNESGDEAAIINAYYVEHDHQASVNISKLKRRVRAANNFVHDLSTKYGSDYCTLFGSYMYMSEEETDEEENNLGGSELPTLVSKPPSYRTELTDMTLKEEQLKQKEQAIIAELENQ
ncbi:hypothetical protein ABG067_007772 [Albugo candida]